MNTPIKFSRARVLPLFAIAALLAAPSVPAQEKPTDSSASPQPFDAPADMALAAMKGRADELHVIGVAVIAYAEGDSVTSWSSKMLVVGSITKPGAQNDKASNLLAIAYSKASEMALTLKDSGSGVRPTMTGEVGWQGGVVSKGKTGILIAAFSGGHSEQDVQISRAGLAILAKSF
jgi:hypothetical protein